ncbi:MAG TPA: LytTR family DNA-binding domain-containing protein [Longimicrobiales bacterium]|nr:LytTR family DNA-binding domain-containing protein [Longimicrobiales bacterium]
MLPATVMTENRYRVRFIVHQRDRHYLVKVDDIDWIESAGNYARLHTTKGAFLLRTTLKDLERSLDPGKFGRVHRGAIVNLDRVAEIRHESFGDYSILLSSGQRLRLSRHYKRNIMR